MINHLIITFGPPWSYRPFSSCCRGCQDAFRTILHINYLFLHHLNTLRSFQLRVIDFYHPFSLLAKCIEGCFKSLFRMLVFLFFFKNYECLFHSLCYLVISKFMIWVFLVEVLLLLIFKTFFVIFDEGLLLSGFNLSLGKFLSIKLLVFLFS